MTDVSKNNGLQWKSEFSAFSEIQLGRPRRANLLLLSCDVIM